MRNMFDAGNSSKTLGWRLGGSCWLLCAMAVASASLAGCSPTSSGYSPTEARLNRLGLSYGLYAGQHQGRPPASIEEMGEFLERSVLPEQLEAMGAKSADDLLVSPRDGKPFKMVALGRLPAPSVGQPPLVVFYEQAGEGGKRYVAYLGGGVEELDEERIKELVPSAS